jgi:hypothetical protein
MTDIIEEESTEDLINNNNNEISQTFNKYQWQQIEKKIDLHEQQVCNSLILLGSGKDFNINNINIVIGDEQYINIRDLIKERLDILPEYKPIVLQTKELKKYKPLSKTEIIKLENTKRLIRENVMEVINSFGKTNNIYCPQNSFKADAIELKGVGLLYCSDYIKKNTYKWKAENEVNLKFVLCVMVALQRFLNKTYIIEQTPLSNEDKSYMNDITYNNYLRLCQKNKLSSNQSLQLLIGKNNVPISPTLLCDIYDSFEELKKLYDYNGFIVQDIIPECLVHTKYGDVDYDIAIPTMKICARNHQIELYNKIKQNFDNGFLLNYIAQISQGKTTSVIMLCSLLETLAQYDKKYKSFQIIFACNLESVKQQVSTLCYSNNIKFAIGGINIRKKQWQIVNNRNCLKTQDPTVIVTSPEIAYNIIKDKGQDNIILFLDESTVASDIYNSDSLYNNCLLLTYLPKRTILSSATQPSFDEITPIVNKFKDQYPNAHIDKIMSNDVQICCDVKSYNHELFVPHVNCKTQLELQHVITMIDKNPFLVRIYSASIVKILYETMEKYKIQNMPNIHILFENIDNMAVNKVKSIALSLLNILSFQTNDIIENVCCSKHNIINNIPIDTKQFATTQAHMFPYVTLIASSSPIEFCNENFKEIVTDVYKSYKKITKCNDGKELLTKDIINKYNTLFEENKNQKNKYESSLKKDKGSKKTGHTQSHEKDSRDKVENKMTKDSISKQKQEYDEKIIKIEFPEFGQINTYHHMKHYSKELTDEFIKKYKRSPLVLESIRYQDMCVSDFVLTLLFCGIGIYQKSKYLCPVYLQTVLELASEGKLVYFCVDHSIVYGTNYKINCIYITDDFAEKHSINTIIQCCGRAGRVGKSYFAHVYISNSTINKFMNFIHNTSYVNIEAQNINKKFLEILSTQKIQQEDTEKSLLDKYLNMTIEESNEPEESEEPQEEQKVPIIELQEVPIAKQEPPITNWRNQQELPTTNRSNQQEQSNTYILNWRNKQERAPLPIGEPPMDIYIPPSQRNKTESWRKN